MNEMKILFMIFYSLVFLSVLFVFCACIVSSRISRQEEYREYRRKTKY